MITINHSILESAGLLVKKHFDSLRDLPEELQNTIVNVYYKYCYLCAESSGKYAWPEMVARSKDLNSGLEEFIRAFADSKAAVETLPKMVTSLRTFQEKEAYEIATLIMLAMFKYKIPDGGRLTVVELKRQIGLSEKNNDEIPGLARLLSKREQSAELVDPVTCWRKRAEDVHEERGGIYFYPFDAYRQKLFNYYIEGFEMGAPEAARELAKLFDGISNPNKLRSINPKLAPVENVHQFNDNYFKGKQEAVKWLQKAANTGDSIAQYELGQKYLSGADVKKSRSEAMKWFKLALSNGHENARPYTKNWFLRWFG